MRFINHLYIFALFAVVINAAPLRGNVDDIASAVVSTTDVVPEPPVAEVAPVTEVTPEPPVETEATRKPPVVIEVVPAPLPTTTTVTTAPATQGSGITIQWCRKWCGW